jgi:hypothetical protein
VHGPIYPRRIEDAACWLANLSRLGHRCAERRRLAGAKEGIEQGMATTWQLLAQLDLLHQLQPPSSPDESVSESCYEEDEADRACG